MVENRSKFISEVEFDIEYAKDHWSELADPDTDNASIRLANREHFEELKNHPQWGGFFKSVKVVVGKKINEGAQAVIYDAKVEFEDGRRSPGYGYYVVKVMKGVCPLQQFQKQWPVGMLCNASKERVKGPLMWIEGGTLLDDRFAFVMLRQWGDLRKLIDHKMQLNFKKALLDHHGGLPELPFEDEELSELVRGCMCSRCDEITSHLLQKKENVRDMTRRPDPPFENVWFIKKVMLCIARDMDTLHSEYGIVHRDLKASNVLLWSFGEELPDKNTHVKANVVDYECSMGVLGTGFWRAPEILQQRENKTPNSELVFTSMSDVYSYGMTCYELVTGRIPFEGQPARDCVDLVLNGHRPALPSPYWLSYGTESGLYEYIDILELLQLCWSHIPSDRPTFLDIVNVLEGKKN